MSLEDLKFSSGDRIQDQNKTRLLGVQIDNSLSLQPFVNQRKAAAMGALWSVQRLKTNGVTQEHLKFAYEAFVRSVLEYAVPPLFPLLNKGQLSSLESVQRIATRVILSDFQHTMPYEERLEVLGLQRLEIRWKSHFTKLASKAALQECFKPYFKPNPSSH